MKLHEIMNRNPLTIELGAALSLAHKKLAWGNVRELPVVDHDKVVGILSEHDLLVFLSDKHEQRTGVPLVEMAMSKPVQTAAPDDSLTEAAARMATAEIGCLPITEKGHLVGLVTTADILRAEVQSSLMPRANPLTASDVMLVDPMTVHEEDFVVDAAAKMQRAGVRHLAVINGEKKAIGVLSDYDVRAAIGDPTSAIGGNVSVAKKLTRVKDVISSRDVSVEATTPLSEVAALFVDYRLAAVPVVTTDGELLGLVSYLDLVRASV